METKKQVIEENPDYKTLINAVLNRLGMESIEDVNNHGIDGGYGGFIYYDDTVAFFKRHRKIILRMAEEMAEGLGQDMLAMIQHFNCLCNTRERPPKPDYSQNEIARAIYQGKGDGVTQIQNAMAWFAAEEVCRMFEE
jgi:hypothetical protein